MPAASAAASTIRASAASRAKGFSQITCLPAPMAARVMSAWVWGGVATVTASTPARLEGVVHRGECERDVEQRGPGRRLVRVPPDQGYHLEAGRPQGAHVGHTAEAGPDHDTPASCGLGHDPARVADAARRAACPAGPKA